MTEHSFQRIAVFIDADNAQAAKIDEVLKDVSAYGRIVLKRAYGNWTKPKLKPWENEIKRLAIVAVQQFDFVQGKNASDIALTIDAMDVLHTGRYDCFVIVSSDSDFTALAIKIHESGVFVIGYGKKQSVESFRNACDEFNYVEDLGQESEQQQGHQDDQSSSPEVTSSSNGTADEKYEINEIDAPNASTGVTEEELDDLLHKAEEKYADDEGYVYASTAGNFIKRVHSDFNIKSIGSEFNKLTDYLKAKKDKYDVKEEKGKGPATLILYKIKKDKTQ